MLQRNKVLYHALIFSWDLFDNKKGFYQLLALLILLTQLYYWIKEGIPSSLNVRLKDLRRHEKQQSSEVVTFWRTPA